MATTLATSPETPGTQPTIEQMSQFDHMRAFAIGKLGQVGMRVSAALEYVSDIPKPKLSRRTKGVVAGLIVSPFAGHTIEQALAQDGTTATDPATAAGIKVYDISDQEATDLYARGMRHCLPRELVVDPHSNHNNPTGKRHNKYGSGWISKSADGGIQKVHMRFRRGYKLCFATATTLDYEVYFPPMSRIKKFKHSAYYVDPISLNSPQNGLAIESFHIGFTRIHKKK
jgi:hypothetical protein